MKFSLATLLAATILLLNVTDGQESGAVTLEQRTESKYKQSAYSFRYKTQDYAKHKNYIDIVYEAGVMRINNHGGQKNRIADLGSMEKLSEVSKVGKSDTRWTQDLLAPEPGHVYAMDVNADNQNMAVVFRVKEASAERMEFEWQTVGKTKKWPVDLRFRGAAGASGMMSRQTAPKKYSKEKSKASGEASGRN